MHSQVIIHHRSLAWRVTTTKRQCSSSTCDGVLQWDGHDVAVFRYSEGVAITFEMLVEHLYGTLVTSGHSLLFTIARLQIGPGPVRTFVKAVTKQFEFTAPPRDSDVQAVHTPLSRETFRNAVRAFSARLVDLTEWHCDTCGDLASAPAIIIDATAIAPPKALSCEPAPRVFADHTKHGSSHKERVLIDDDALRELLYRFCGRAISKSERKILEFTEKVSVDCRSKIHTALFQLERSLLSRLKETKSVLEQFICFVLKLPRDADGFCSAPWKDVLLALASNHACAGGLIKLPILVLPVLDKLIDGRCLIPSDSSILFRLAAIALKILKCWCRFFPVLYVLALHQQWSERPAAEPVVALLRALRNKCDIMNGSLFSLARFRICFSSGVTKGEHAVHIISDTKDPVEGTIPRVTMCQCLSQICTLGFAILDSPPPDRSRNTAKAFVMAI